MKENSGNNRKRRNLSRNTTRVEAANVAVARRIIGRSRKKVTPRGDTGRAGTTIASPGTANTNASISSMFGDNIEVSGGQFIIAETVNNNVKRIRAKDPFKLLQKHVATSAFHNSAQRVDPPRCHPGTREEIMKRIYNWIIQSEGREKWLLWLNGAAGAGKSAIMQSIAEKCALTGIAIASFFFFKGDHTRNTITPLVATLVYQLIRAIPKIKDDIFLDIERDPLIFDQSFEYQLQQLIILPLLRLPIELQRLFVVLIDGLDECNDRVHQTNLVKVLGHVSHNKVIPVVFLVASRREPQIEAEFVQRSVSDLLFTLPLDNSDVEQTSDDIWRFLIDRFQDIKETHLHRQFIPPSWPPMQAIEEIVAKSSGQFIFASVSVNFISSPRNNPARQLEVIRGIRLRDASQNPFAHLDALYQHIFSQVEALDKVLAILALQMILHLSLSQLERGLQLDRGEAALCLADLTTVITCDYQERRGAGRLKFLHASLPDFLLDKSRSGIYHIDLDEYSLKLLCMFLERPPPILDSPSLTVNDVSDQEALRLGVIEDLIQKTHPRLSDRLHTAFMNFNFTLYSEKMTLVSTVDRCCTSILKYLYQQKLYDQGQAYHYVFNMFASGYKNIGINFQDWMSKEARSWYLELLSSERASTVTLSQAGQ